MNHTEFGQTHSRADGMFDLAVNGGSLLTITYEKSGYLPVQRQVHAPWQDFAIVDSVAMVQLDPAATTVDLTLSTPVQSAQSSLVSDADGSRRATLMFKAGTTATMTLPGGGTQPLTSLTVRTTEYTVGPGGPAAMPAPLPPTSAYTYAAELSVDEAIAANATGVQFSVPVPVYVSNFLGVPVGMIVPVGHYNRTRGVWEPEPNGRVVKVLAINGGVADLDVQGTGQPADQAALDSLDISTAERQEVAARFAVGQSFMRAAVIRFSPKDLNYPVAPPQDQPPGGSDSPNNNQPDSDNCLTFQSIVECQNRILGERLALAGTPFTLNYRSDRVDGNSRSNSVTIPITPATVPPTLIRVELNVSIAGQVFHQTFTTAPNQNYVFTWDERDGYGRAVRGGRRATVKVTNVYPLLYIFPAAVANAFGLPCFGEASGGGLLCQNISPWSRTTEAFRDREYQVTLGSLRFQAVGGWTLSAHHAYDAGQEMLHLGTGDRVAGKQIGSKVRGIAGGDQGNSQFGDGYAGDGGPASLAKLSIPDALAVDGSGQIYVVDQRGLLIRRFTPDGTITTIAGHPTETCTSGPCGDGGPAASARFASITGLAAGPDGSIYIADQFQRRVRRIDPQGNISGFAGSGEPCDTDLDPTCGEGAPAVSAPIQRPVALAFDANGELLIAAGNQVLAVRTNGTIRTLVGSGAPCSGGGPCGDGAAARLAQIEPGALAADPAGGYYVVDLSARRVRRVDAGGVIHAFAGSGEFCEVGDCGDGGPALSATFGFPEAITLGPDRSLYVVDVGENVVRRVGLDGIITTVAGPLDGSGGGATLRAGLRVAGFRVSGGPVNVVEGCWPKTEDGNLIAGRNLCRPRGLAFLPDHRLVYASAAGNRVFEVSPPMPKSVVSDVLVGSPDGAERYLFDASGRHLKTLDAQTGVVDLTFGYDGAGRLTSIQDAFSNLTSIQRDGGGVPTALVAPRGQSTAVNVDGNGYLERIVGPAADTTILTHGITGLLTALRDANGFFHAYAYDATGRLAQDLDPAGGSLMPTQVEDSTGYTVTQTTALGRATSYGVHGLSNGTIARMATGPEGLTSTTMRKRDGAVSVSEPNGMTIDYKLGPDPVLGLQSLLPSTLNIKSPGGKTFGLTVSAGATTDPLNAARVLTRSDTIRVNNRIFTTTYDGVLRKYTTTTPMGRQSISFVDSLGRVTQVQTPGLSSVLFTYDSLGRVRQATSGARTTHYAYNSSGLLQSVTDPLNRSTSFSYDSIGRVLTQTNPGGGVIGFGYDMAGRLTSVTPPGRTAHLHSYSPVGLRTGYIPPGGVATGTNWNADKQLDNSVTADGDTLRVTYDGAGRAQSLSGSTGTLGVTYHPTTGAVTALKGVGGDSLKLSYDGLLPTSATWTGAISGMVGISYNNDFAPSAVSINGSPLATYGYDSDGLITAAGSLTLTRAPQHGKITGATLGAVATSYGYNGFGELMSQTTTVSGSPIYQTNYARDNGGRITTVNDTVQGVATDSEYIYATSGRLQDVKRNTVLIASYQYDSNGNRTQVTTAGGTIGATYDDQDRLLTYGNYHYSWSNAGQLKQRVNGTDTTKYTYDSFGTLNRVMLGNGTDIQYLSDAKRRRIGKLVSGTLVRGWLYQSQLAPAAEVDSSGQVVSKFVYATRVNVPDYMIKGGSTYRLITDHLGSVRLVVDEETGIVAQRLDYDEWGRTSQNTNPGFQPFGYGGGLYDDQSGLVQFGARDYDAETGRWTTREPLGFFGGSANLFEYAHGDPVSYADFGGENPTPASGPENLGLGWRARVDAFNLSGTSHFEIHVFTPQGQLHGVFGVNGWINRHGGIPSAELPEEVFARLNGLNVAEARARGWLPPKGVAQPDERGANKGDIKGYKYLRGRGKVLGALGWVFEIFDWIRVIECAQRLGVSPFYYYLLERGMVAPPIPLADVQTPRPVFVRRLPGDSSGSRQEK